MKAWSRWSIWKIRYSFHFGKIWYHSLDHSIMRYWIQVAMNQLYGIWVNASSRHARHRKYIHNRNKANLRNLIAATVGVVFLLKIVNHQFLSLCDLEIWWMTSKNNRAPFLHYFKFFASFQSHRWILTGITVRKCSIRVKTAIFCPAWPWNLTDDFAKQ